MTETIRPDNYLNDLTLRAFQKDGFGTLCTLLRVSGLADAQWDPYEESHVAFDDFDWMLKTASDQRSGNAEIRVALLMYCQAVEMSAAHIMLFNLLRVLSGQGYSVQPFSNLFRGRKRDPFGSVPPSAKQKFKEISRLATETKEHRLVDLIASFFNDEVRNAFSHSDYILAETGLRWNQSGLWKELPYPALQTLINNCLDFYRPLLRLDKTWLSSVARLKRFHKWPNYEVLELLSDQTHGVYGFNIHYSNGSKTTFARTEAGVDSCNLSFGEGGKVQLFMGNLDELAPVWKVNGTRIDDIESLNSGGEPA